MSKRIPKTIISFEHNYYLDEDVFKMVNKLEQENKQLKEEIKKYINSSDFVYDELYKKREKIEKILGGE